VLIQVAPRPPSCHAATDLSPRCAGRRIKSLIFAVDIVICFCNSKIGIDA